MMYSYLIEASKDERKEIKKMEFFVTTARKHEKKNNKFQEKESTS